MENIFFCWEKWFVVFFPSSEKIHKISSIGNCYSRNCIIVIDIWTLFFWLNPISYTYVVSKYVVVFPSHVQWLNRTLICLLLCLINNIATSGGTGVPNLIFNHEIKQTTKPFDLPSTHFFIILYYEYPDNQILGTHSITNCNKLTLLFEGIVECVYVEGLVTKKIWFRLKGFCKEAVSGRMVRVVVVCLALMVYTITKKDHWKYTYKAQTFLHLRRFELKKIDIAFWMFSIM